MPRGILLKALGLGPNEDSISDFSVDEVDEFTEHTVTGVVGQIFSINDVERGQAILDADIRLFAIDDKLEAEVVCFIVMLVELVVLTFSNAVLDVLLSAFTFILVAVLTLDNGQTGKLLLLGIIVWTMPMSEDWVASSLILAMFWIKEDTLAGIIERAVDLLAVIPLPEVSTEIEEISLDKELAKVKETAVEPIKLLFDADNVNVMGDTDGMAIVGMIVSRNDEKFDLVCAIFKLVEANLKFEAILKVGDIV